MARFGLLGCLFLVLITQLKVAKVPELIKDEFERKIKDLKKQGFKDSDDSVKLLQMFFDILDSSSLVANYELTDWISDNDNILLFQAKQKKNLYLCKVIIEYENDHKYCDIEKENIAINKLNISYMNKIIYLEEGSKKYGDKKLIYCISIFEDQLKQINSGRLFSKNTRKELYNNRKKLFTIITKLIIAITELNFKANILHGDIRPDNIYIKYDPQSYESLEDYDPVVTNFKQIVENQFGKILPSDEIRYEEKYRPKEMTDKIDYSTNGRKMLIGYHYSKDFLEDVYALGVTIKEIITHHQDKNYLEKPLNKALLNIADDMIDGEDVPNPKNPTQTISVRPNMKDVLLKLYKSMKDLIDSNPDSIDSSLLRQVKTTLEFFNVKLSSQII